MSPETRIALEEYLGPRYQAQIKYSPDYFDRIWEDAQYAFKDNDEEFMACVVAHWHDGTVDDKGSPRSKWKPEVADLRIQQEAIRTNRVRLMKHEQAQTALRAPVNRDSPIAKVAQEYRRLGLLKRQGGPYDHQRYQRCHDWLAERWAQKYPNEPFDVPPLTHPKQEIA